MKICKKSAFIGLIIGVLTALVFAAAICQTPKKQIFVYVNIDKVIAEVMGRVKENISNETTAKETGINEEIENYKKAFSKTLDDYAKTNDVIIFSSPKAIAGVKDVTAILIDRAFKKESRKKRDKDVN